MNSIKCLKVSSLFFWSINKAEPVLSNPISEYILSPSLESYLHKNSRFLFIPI